ncbi:hypothetical protein D9757_012489 [Collybiopsis confluens]|uniref:Auxin efflux carrier n=1 Tax=Collybiopsis confluens TaxID=2823264 RepID=A0A8H5GH77_9AGAR|nr:hypothetical protein D9757_012489 [Collybiopsis confluens]
MSSSILTAFVATVEAASSVLLTVFYGAVAGHLGLVSSKSAVDLSALAVKLFLPCLLFVNMGSGFSWDSIGTFVPIIVWALGYNIISMILGSTATRIFELPAWVTAAVTFNNTTSLPLLLLQSFAVSGALSSISAGDSAGAINRAQTYFLINATISNTLTFSLGPRLLKPDEGQDERIFLVEGERSDLTDAAVDNEEQIPLFPKPEGVPWAPSWAHSIRHFSYQFWNAPLIGACIGTLPLSLVSCLFTGVVPALHRHFFDTEGFFRAWLTVSLTNLGNLFAGVQVIVVGLKLHFIHVKIRLREDSGSVPLYPSFCVLLTRFVIMPMISIPLIYILATKTHLLLNDPILWFCMMMMPVGPSALRLTALADVSNVDENEKMAIAKFLALSYIVTPLFCFAAVASLKACEMAILVARDDV